MPEILAKAAAIEIAREFAAAAKEASSEDFDNLYSEFIGRCERFPAPDCVGAAALQDIFKKHESLLIHLISKMVEDEPETTTIGEGANILMQLPGGGSVDVNVPLGGGGPAIGNLLPHLILSQIVAMPMVMNKPGDVNARLAITIGTFRHPLLRTDPRLQEWLRIEVHELPDGGAVICPYTGVVEPLVQGIVLFLQAPQLRDEAPALIGWLAEAAANVSDPSLTLRLYTALGELETSVIGQIASAARAARKNVLGPTASRLIAQLHHPNT